MPRPPAHANAQNGRPGSDLAQLRGGVAIRDRHVVGEVQADPRCVGHGLDARVSPNEGAAIGR